MPRRRKYGMMEIKERIVNLKKKIETLKNSRSLGIKKATIKFKPFSKKQKKVLTWWTKVHRHSFCRYN